MKLRTVFAEVTVGLLMQAVITWVTTALDNLNASPPCLRTEYADARIR